MGTSAESLPSDYPAALLMASPNAVVLFDDGGNVLYQNASAGALFGRELSHLEGFSAGAPPEDAETLRELLAPAGDHAGLPKLIRFKAETGSTWRVCEAAV